MKYLDKAKKSLGQNFLIDKNIIDKIVEIGNINKNKIVVEIGAGSGNLTKKIADMKPKKVFAIEKDKKLSLFLRRKFQDNDSVKIVNEDIFNFINNKIENKDVIVFGNLPYNISTQILASLIMLKKWPPWYEVLIFMFQKEVADRILAQTQTKEFGRLSILSNWRLEIKKHFYVSKNSFLPKPKISSTLLSFRPKKNNPYKLKNPKTLEKITRVLFSNRRKMINKNFEKLFGKSDVAKNLNINLQKRPEDLDNDIFYKLAQQYESLFG